METNNQNNILLNTFVIHNKRYRVFLNSNVIIWEKENSNEEKTILDVCDIISVSTIKKLNKKRSNNETTTTPGKSNETINNQDQDDIIDDKDDVKSLLLHYAKRKDNKKNINKWRLHTIKFCSQEYRTIQLWKDTIQNALNEQEYRPKRLLLFINPYGGKKNALKIFEKYGKPLFKIGNIDVNVIISQRANQIRDFILTQSINFYDGIICVGGDGTFSEVFNGLLLRTMTDLKLNTQNPDYYPVPTIPIGIIPGGSTDTVAYCIHGTTDIVTSIIHIMLGQTDGMDLSSVSNNSGLMRFYASIMSYGYLGDVAVDSEKFRWMGPKRYDYSGFKKFLSNRGYESEISFVLDENSNPNEGQKCLENCLRCIDKKIIHDNYQQHQLLQQSNCAINNDDNDVENDREMIIGDNNLNCNNFLKWKTIKGKFFMVNCANMSCACPRSPNGFSPYCHIGDGCMDLILVKHTTFFNNIKLLLKLSSDNGRIAELPFVEIYRTKKFCFRTPLQQNSSISSLSNSTQPLRIDQQLTSNWNCDGEVILDSNVMIRGHCQLIKVFRRGLNVDNTHDDSGCCCRK